MRGRFQTDNQSQTAPPPSHSETTNHSGVKKRLIFYPKIKNVQKDLNGMIKRESDFGRLEGQINCELPNNAIYKFEGNIEISTMPNRISLGADNMVLRGSSLRNTEYVYGIAVFTGHDTKVMQNSAQAKMKFSRLDLMTNRCIFVIMFF